MSTQKRQKFTVATTPEKIRSRQSLVQLKGKLTKRTTRGDRGRKYYR
ncbi:MAG: hypothetical protein QNJ72_03965 [Pleurocapsa sp. MO_226.B13]|nr:hypothetical protein [Pleurocapsa sp. MO_226.B13]